MKPELLALIRQVDNYEDLREINNVVREVWRGLGRSQARGLANQFSAGQRVQCDGRSRGKLTGTVEKLNRTTATVMMDNGTRYRVALSALEPLEGAPGREATVEDAIAITRQRMAEADSRAKPMPDWRHEVPYFNGPDSWKVHEARLNERWEEEKAYQASLPEGLVLGKLVQFQIGDGYAYYRVVKINARSVRLRWQALHCDNWENPALGREGNLDRSRVAALIEQREALDKLFAKRSAS